MFVKWPELPGDQIQELVSWRDSSQHGGCGGGDSEAWVSAGVPWGNSFPFAQRRRWGSGPGGQLCGLY